MSTPEVIVLILYSLAALVYVLGTPDNIANNYGGRLDQYVRREHMTTWVGAGLGGMFVLIGGYISARDFDSDIWTPVLITLLLASGLAFAFARVGFEWEATGLRRSMRSDNVAETAPLPQNLARFPRGSEVCWRLALVLTLATGTCFLIGVWGLRESETQAEGHGHGSGQGAAAHHRHHHHPTGRS